MRKAYDAAVTLHARLPKLMKPRSYSSRCKKHTMHLSTFMLAVQNCRSPAHIPADAKSIRYLCMLAFHNCGQGSREPRKNGCAGTQHVASRGPRRRNLEQRAAEEKPSENPKEKHKTTKRMTRTRRTRTRTTTRTTRRTPPRRWPRTRTTTTMATRRPRATSTTTARKTRRREMARRSASRIGMSKL